MITLPTSQSNTGYFPMTTKSILVKRQQTKKLTHRVNTSSLQTLNGQTTRVGSVSLDISTCQFYRHLHHNSHLHHGPYQYVYCVPKEIHISLISTNPALNLEAAPLRFSYQPESIMVTEWDQLVLNNDTMIHTRSTMNHSLTPLIKQFILSTVSM